MDAKIDEELSAEQLSEKMKEALDHAQRLSRSLESMVGTLDRFVVDINQGDETLQTEGGSDDG